MTIYNGLIGLFWFIFLIVWIVSSFSAKKTVGRSGGWLWVRVLVVIFAFFLFRSQIFRWLGPYDAAVVGNPELHLFGVILCGAGIAFAIWARVYLGKNWGMPMSIKENPELVTSGPYTYVRHPIYTGMLFAMLGSVFASGLEWLVPLALFAAYFLRSAEKEEELMAKQFPDQYPAYKHKTKMLVPFIY